MKNFKFLFSFVLVGFLAFVTTGVASENITVVNTSTATTISDSDDSLITRQFVLLNVVVTDPALSPADVLDTFIDSFAANGIQAACSSERVVLLPVPSERVVGALYLFPNGALLIMESRLAPDTSEADVTATAERYCAENYLARLEAAIDQAVRENSG